MRKLALSIVAASLIVGSNSLVAKSNDGINILNDVKLNAQIRPRYEYADLKDNNKDAGQAFTARTKLNISGNLFGVDGLSTNVGVISVNNFGWNNYDSKYSAYNPGKDKYDVIVDPQYAMISNADINYKVGKTLFHAGRSQVNLDNQRFIGTVGWRQLERSYDTVFVKDNSVKNLNLLATWVYGYQGVKAGPTTDTNSVLLHVSYKVNEPLAITAYDYMLANKDDTIGLALTGKVDVGAKISYRVEYAKQLDNTMKYGSNAPSNKVDASYYNIDVTANMSGFIVGLNYEFLSGDNNTTTKRESFIPWLGTNHKFNGWADMFYVASNPAGGLIDINSKIGYKNKKFGKFLAIYHQFKSDKKISNEDDLGSEIDILYANNIPYIKSLKGLIKGAFYKKGNVLGYTNDKQVFWVMLDYKFMLK